MGRLTGTVAHELRNPLGVIATSIGLIETRSRQAGTEVRKALDRARRSIKRCETIITEHLDFARAKGHQPVSLILDYWLSGVLDEIIMTGDIDRMAMRAASIAVSKQSEGLCGERTMMGLSPLRPYMACMWLSCALLGAG